MSGRRRWVAFVAVVAPGIALVVAMVFAAGFLADRDAGRTDAGRLYGGTELAGPAPPFTLTDQRGQEVSLVALRGRVVLLAFLDPKCTDVCPLTASRFRRVTAALGDRAAQVAFLAVNVNPEASAVADVAAASQLWGVDGMPGWHFLTGMEQELSQVWAGYGILAGQPKPGKHGEVLHTPGVFVIDRSGGQRWYVSVPDAAVLPLDGPPVEEVLLRRVRELLAE